MWGSIDKYVGEVWGNLSQRIKQKVDNIPTNNQAPADLGLTSGGLREIPEQTLKTFKNIKKSSTNIKTHVKTCRNHQYVY